MCPGIHQYNRTPCIAVVCGMARRITTWDGTAQRSTAQHTAPHGAAQHSTTPRNLFTKQNQNMARYTIRTHCVFGPGEAWESQGDAVPRDHHVR